MLASIETSAVISALADFIPGMLDAVTPVAIAAGVVFGFIFTLFLLTRVFMIMSGGRPQ